MASSDLLDLGCTTNPTVAHALTNSHFRVCESISSENMPKVVPSTYVMCLIFLLTLVWTAFSCSMFIGRYLIARDRGLSRPQAWKEACWFFIRLYDPRPRQRSRRRTHLVKMRTDADLDREEGDVGMIAIEKG